jgi:hypothetical protein
MYAACVIICLTSLFTLNFHQIVKEPRLIDDAFRAMRLFTSLVLLPLVACLIPYMYGKLLYSTSFPNVTVTFSGDAALGKAAPTGDHPLDSIATPRILVIDETDKYISLLYPQGPIPYRVEILHRDDIRSMQRYGEKDVLNTMLIQCDWLP